jgi:probable rRNA maturation factor
MEGPEEKFSGPQIMIVIDPSQPFSSVTKLSGPTALPGKRTLERFLQEARAAVRLRGEVSVLLTNDKTIRDLNKRFRKKDKATDVLSFPAADSGSGIVGDLAISLETAAVQAESFGHSLREEVKVLLLHGLLHLAGYDHETDEGQMGRREAALRKRFSLPLGLIQRTSVPDGELTLPKRNSKAQPARKRGRGSR